MNEIIRMAKNQRKWARRRAQDRDMAGIDRLLSVGVYKFSIVFDRHIAH
jgi:hypothetical protein